MQEDLSFKLQEGPCRHLRAQNTRLQNFLIDVQLV